ncbi:MAG: sialate O-acetylesterase [Agriterribacter sp.]
MKPATCISTLIIFFGIHAGSVMSQNIIKVAAIFGDDMVLQRQKPVKIWGESKNDNRFVVSFKGETKQVKPDRHGKWSVSFSPSEAGGPYEMLFSGEENFSFHNILMGDVWFCSGQSNMEWPAMSAFNGGYELKHANYPEIRDFHVEPNTSGTPQNTLASGAWQVCTPENTASFSAVAYFFARNIHLTEKVPVGIINASWGGTLIESWASAESLVSHPDYREQIQKLVAGRGTPQDFDSLQKRTAAQYTAWENNIQQADSGYLQKWYAPDYDVTNWSTLVAPGYWENQGLKDFDGVVWLRKTFDVPNSMLNRELVVNLEILSDYDQTFFNGKFIGAVGWDNGRRIYCVPASLVKPGANNITVRLFNKKGDGGFKSKNATDLYIRELVESPHPLLIPLSGEWQYKPSLPVTTIPPQPAAGPGHSMPTSIYNGMVYPFRDLALKGFLWYQGESNNSRAYQYRTLTGPLIEGWRKQFNQGDLPFLYVQLSGFGAIKSEPTGSSWAELRESQDAALQLPNTGMAVTWDVGNPFDVHPPDKQTVGYRLAMEAERLVYGKSGIETSPTYKSMVTEGNKVRISFNNAAHGLKTINNDVKGFTIAGADQKFVFAKAIIEGKDVIVWNDNISHPVAVRFAWTESPKESFGANLYNVEGFPVSPFRTDNWEAISRDWR